MIGAKDTHFIQDLADEHDSSLEVTVSCLRHGKENSLT